MAASSEEAPQKIPSRERKAARTPTVFRGVHFPRALKDCRGLLSQEEASIAFCLDSARCDGSGSLSPRHRTHPAFAPPMGTAVPETSAFRGVRSAGSPGTFMIRGKPGGNRETGPRVCQGTMRTCCIPFGHNDDSCRLGYPKSTCGVVRGDNCSSTRHGSGSCRRSPKVLSQLSGADITLWPGGAWETLTEGCREG